MQFVTTPFSKLYKTQQEHAILSQSIWIEIIELEHKEDGMVPPKRVLLVKSRRYSCLRFTTVDGIVPVNWLKLRLSSVSFTKAPNVDSMVPENWLLLRLNCSSSVRFPNLGGMVPVNRWLPDVLNSPSLIIFPSSDGRVPVNWVSYILKRSSLVRLPIVDGMVPNSWRATISPEKRFAFFSRFQFNVTVVAWKVACNF